MKTKRDYKIWWDEEEKLVRAQAFGELDETAAHDIFKETKIMAQVHGDKLDWQIDLRKMTKATSKARKILAEATGHPSINKYAFFGASIFIRTVANFIASAAQQKNARHFAHEKDALEWLKEDM